MNTKHKTRGNLRGEIVEQRKQGMVARASTWSPNGDKKDSKKSRRQWKSESKNW